MYAATVLGPVVAFIGGGFLLKLYTHFNTVDMSTSVNYLLMHMLVSCKIMKLISDIFM